MLREGGGLETDGGGPSDKSRQQLVLKCDLQERILDPTLFGANLQQQMVRSNSYIMCYIELLIVAVFRRAFALILHSS